MSARDLCGRLRAGELTCAEVAHAFLETTRGDPLRAWQAVDGDLLLAQAAALDALTAQERASLPLLGLPIGIKDNFDTADLPTTYGSPIYAGHKPSTDAALVTRLRAAGALIAGKTKSAEFAWMTPPDTRNPLDPSRTPGGSSSGSAAAVAAGHVLVATGTQTAGSINRPASYCGIVGYKPTFGALPRDGVKLLSPVLDTAGLLAATLDDVRIVAAALGVGTNGVDDADRGTPKLAFAPTPQWVDVEPDAQRAIDAFVTAHNLESIDLPESFTDLLNAQITIQTYDAARSLAYELEAHRDQLSDELRQALDTGAAIPDHKRRQAADTVERHTPELTDLLSRYDAILTPSATGVPPQNLAFTGDPMFCRVWTLTGAPCISLPLVTTQTGLPVGLQLVGAPHRDRALLDAAKAFA